MTRTEAQPASPTADGVPANPARRVFVVAGMHRAGTSVVARGLQALGVDLGERLMSADLRVNARGFFEDIDIVKLDDGLLDATGADWKGLALLDDVDWRGTAFAAARSDARQLLEARLVRSAQFGFKDPRVPRLLPFWQGIFAEAGVADAYVIAVRHPLSVIDSLTARDRLDVRRSSWLWLTHLVCALHYTAGRPRVVVDYDCLLAAPEHELARMATALGMSAAAFVEDDVTTYAREFLSRELRHAEHTPADLDAAAVTPLVRDAFALAQRLGRDEAEVDSDAIRAEVGALFARLAAMSPLLAYAGSVERAADQVPRLEGELAWARSSVDEAAAFNADMKAALAEAQRNAAASIADLKVALDESHRYVESLVATLALKDEALGVARTYSEDLKATLALKDEALGVAKTYNEDLLAALRHKETELAQLRAEADALAATLARVRERWVGRALLRWVEPDRGRDAAG